MHPRALHLDRIQVGIDLRARRQWRPSLEQDGSRTPFDQLCISRTTPRIFSRKTPPISIRLNTGKSLKYLLAQFRDGLIREPFIGV